MICAMAWVVQRYECEDTLVCNENVWLFPPDAIMSVLKDNTMSIQWSWTPLHVDGDGRNDANAG